MPDYAQAPALATLTGDDGQPAGTRYYWSYNTNLATLVPNSIENDSPGARVVTLGAKSMSAYLGDITVNLFYRLTLRQRDGSEVTFEAQDYGGTSSYQGYATYHKFTSHAPYSMVDPHQNDFVHRHYDLAIVMGPPWRCTGYYWYRVRDQFQVSMAGLWVQERFPAGVPPGLTVNGDETHWTTLSGPWPDANPYSAGRFDEPDILDSGYWPVRRLWATNPAYGPVAHDYHGGTSSVSASPTNGLLIGQYTLRIGTDRTSN